MELIDFNLYIRDEISSLAEQNGLTIRESFYNFYSDKLMDAEEFDNFQYLSFEGIGKNGRRVQIDGYTYDELDEVLILFIAPVLSNFNFETITKSDADRLFKRALSFYEDANIVVRTAEESTEGYGLAKDCLSLYKNVKKIRIYLFTDQIMSKQIKSIENDKLDDIEVEYHLWDLERIHKLFESGETKEEIEIDLFQFTQDGIPCLIASKTDDYESFLCNMPGILLARLYNRYGGRLLEGNVRSFLQTKGKVNKGIRTTILNNPNMFFAYNNGITTTASDIQIENRNGQYYITNIKGLQIVNGGQTTASLANALENDTRENSEEKIKQIYVPMKLSKVTLDKAQELIPNISRYANSQNKVSDSDLWSNHPYHIKIEEYSRRITAPATNGNQYGTKWYYERATGQYLQETYKSTPKERERFLMLNPKNQMFKKTDLSKYVNIHEMMPHIASAGGQKSFTKFADSIKDQWEKNSNDFNEEYFKRLVSVMIIIKETDRIIKGQSWFRGSYKANIVAYTVSRLVYEISNKYPDRVLPYRTIWTKQKVSIIFEKAIQDISEKMYNHLIDKNRQRENVTEWAKMPECWKQAKDSAIKLSDTFINELEYKADLYEIKKYARKDAKQEELINAIVEVVNFGVDGWKHLLSWGIERHYFNPTELEFIKLAISMERGKLPSDKQSQKIIQILNKAREDSYPG